MRAALELLPGLDVGYEIPMGADVVSDPVPAGKNAPAAFAALYSVTDGISLPDVHNGYFIDGAERLVARGQDGEPFRVSGTDPMDVKMFGSDGGGGRFVLRIDDGSVWYLPDWGGVHDGVYQADEHTRPLRLTDSLNEFLWRLLGDVEAYLKADTRHRFLGEYPFPPRGARLIVQPTSLRPGGLGPDTGEIWLKAGHIKFPREGWNDFILLVLGSWLESARRLLDGSSRYETIRFMEGPYSVEIEADTAARWTLTVVSRLGERPETDREPIDVGSFVRSLIDAAEAVIGAGLSAGISPSLISRLAADKDVLVARLESRG
jgi:hypothetical protein